MSEKLQYCPETLPVDLRNHAKALAVAWIDSPLRPRISQETADHWSQLIEEWIASGDVPLFVRKKGQHGFLLTHSTGRFLIPCDNSTAHWAYALALCDIRPTLPQIRQMLGADQIPVAMVFVKEEFKIAQFKCSRQPANLNELGWTICHIDPVGIGYKGVRTKVPIGDLEQHFRKYTSPYNMFLVPKMWSGLGEMPEMIAAARAAGQP